MSKGFIFHSGPSAPTQPTLVTADTSSLTFQWEAPLFVNILTSITGYNILREGNFIANVSATTLIYTDIGLTDDTVYEYTIIASVIDENSVIFNGEPAIGHMQTLSSSNNNAVIGGSIAGVFALLLIIVVIAYLSYRKIRRVKEHVEDIKVANVEHASEMGEFAVATPLAVSQATPLAASQAPTNSVSTTKSENL